MAGSRRPSRLSKILDAHKVKGENDGVNAFIRALVDGSIRLADGAQVPGSIAAGVILADAQRKKPQLSCNKKETRG